MKTTIDGDHVLKMFLRDEEKTRLCFSVRIYVVAVLTRVCVCLYPSLFGTLLYFSSDGLLVLAKQITHNIRNLSKTVNVFM
jgi:hypothetical protein